MMVSDRPGAGEGRATEGITGMTAPRRRPGRSRAAPKIRPAQLLAGLVVLGVFVAGVVIAGVVGAILVGALAIGAGVLLALRWNALDERIRLFRVFVVLICVAVAISLLYR
jgi:hypothetical protein